MEGIRNCPKTATRKLVKFTYCSGIAIATVATNPQLEQIEYAKLFKTDLNNAIDYGTELSLLVWV